MAANPELLTTREAAVVAGVEVRDINRLIDEHILPDELVRNDSTRLLWAGACALVRFYYGAEKALTADERKGAIRHVCLDARSKRLTWTIKRWRQARPHWTYRHDHFLTLNFDRFVEDTINEHARLTKAREIVGEDPHILGGTPVVKGSRVPVYDIAASAARGLTPAEIKEDYPGLDEEKIALAILYAKATPQRGRPKTMSSADRGTPVSRKVVKRRPA
jgi:uncharacterized protein (DUF433 family)